MNKTAWETSKSYSEALVKFATMGIESNPPAEPVLIENMWKRLSIKMDIDEGW